MVLGRYLPFGCLDPQGKKEAEGRTVAAAIWPAALATLEWCPFHAGTRVHARNGSKLCDMYI